MTTPAQPLTSWRSVGADLVRLAGVISFGLAIPRGFVAAALLALVLLGLTLARVLRLPPELDLALGTAMLAAAWSSLLDLYLTYPDLDLVVHAILTGLVAAALHGVLVTAGVVHGVDDPELRRPLVGVVLVVTALGLALGVLWELGEWYGHTYLDPRIQTGYDDTITDLALGGLGSLAAAAFLALQRRPHGPADGGAQPGDRARASSTAGRPS